MARYSFLLAMFLVSLVITACGTKGPLYIPEQRYPQKSQEQTNEPVRSPTSSSTKE